MIRAIRVLLSSYIMKSLYTASCISVVQGIKILSLLSFSLPVTVFLFHAVSPNCTVKYCWLIALSSVALGHPFSIPFDVPKLHHLSAFAS